MPYFAAQFSAVRGHRAAAVGVEERRPQVVLELPLAEAQAVSKPADDVRRLAHALGAAGEHDVGLAEQNHLPAADGRLNAGTAQPIDRQRRHFDRHARLQPDVARAVDRVGARLQHVAEDDVIDHASGATPVRCHRRARRERAEIERRDVLELAGVFGHRRPRAAEDVDLLDSFIVLTVALQVRGHVVLSR